MLYLLLMLLHNVMIAIKILLDDLIHSLNAFSRFVFVQPAQIFMVSIQLLKFGRLFKTLIELLGTCSATIHSTN